MEGIEGIVFILDRPQDVVNVGAVVRLLGNFGLPRLRLVEPAAFDPERILTIARRGHDVLAATERFGSLDLALADCAFVLGTTSRERAQARPLLTPRQAAPALLAVAAMRGSAGERDGPQLPSGPPIRDAEPASLQSGGAAPMEQQGSALARPGLAAVLFGPENFGLSNAALDRCHAILRIPTVPHDASLNLAQAALLVAYELFLAATEPLQGLDPAVMPGGLAVGADLEAMFAALERLLRSLHPQGIPGRTAATMSRLRALFLRAAPASDEAALLTQIFEHAARAVAVR